MMQCVVKLFKITTQRKCWPARIFVFIRIGTRSPCHLHFSCCCFFPLSTLFIVFDFNVFCLSFLMLFFVYNTLYFDTQLHIHLRTELCNFCFDFVHSNVPFFTSRSTHLNTMAAILKMIRPEWHIG